MSNEEDKLKQFADETEGVKSDAPKKQVFKLLKKWRKLL
jgi:hypothetical protein